MKAEAKNMRILAQSDMGGVGKGGEGMGMVVRDGRRFLFVAHESAPANFSVVDVTKRKSPQLVAQTMLPHADVRSNSLSVMGDLMAVAYETEHPGQEPAGLELFDISDPSRPTLVGKFDASGPTSRGAHFVWLDTEGFAYIASGMPDWRPKREKDDQVVLIVDVRDPRRPREVGRWWLPGTAQDDPETLPTPPNPVDDTGYKAHNINVYPERPDRAYIGYKDGGVIILDISDRRRPKMISRYDHHPPLRGGFTHTVVPLFQRGLLVVSEEAIMRGKEKPGWDHPKCVWIMNAQLEDHPIPLSTLPMPDVEDFRHRGGRFGAHNVHENDPTPTAWKSENLIFGAFFNAGIRAYDIRNPMTPVEVGYIIPEAPAGAPYGTAQMNDVYVSEERVIYALERTTGGLYVMELDYDERR